MHIIKYCIKTEICKQIDKQLDFSLHVEKFKGKGSLINNITSNVGFQSSVNTREYHSYIT